MSMTNSEIASFRARLTEWFGSDDAPNAIIEDYGAAVGVPEEARLMLFVTPVRMKLLHQRERGAFDVEQALQFMAAQAAAASATGGVAIDELHRN